VVHQDRDPPQFVGLDVGELVGGERDRGEGGDVTATGTGRWRGRQGGCRGRMYALPSDLPAAGARRGRVTGGEQRLQEGEGQDRTQDTPGSVPTAACTADAPPCLYRPRMCPGKPN
jgi:hypothetical protein